MNSNSNTSYFNTFLLSTSLEVGHVNKWIAECSHVIKSMGGVAYIPGRIGRSEPAFRRAGGMVLEAPLDKPTRKDINSLKDFVAKHNVEAFICFDIKQVALAKTLQTISMAPIILVLLAQFEAKSILNRIQNNSVLRKVDHFIVPSRALVDYLHREHQVEVSKISFVHEGIDFANISNELISQERTMSLAASWAAIEDPSEIVLIEANFQSQNWRMNLQKFVQEWQSKPRPQVRFVIIGDDNGSGHLRDLSNLVQNKYLNSSFQFVGHCADIEAAIKLSSAAIVLPSEDESRYPIALIGQAIGRRILLPNSDAAQEFLPTAFHSSALTNDAILTCEAIEVILTRDEGQRNSDALIARNFINQSFTIDIMRQEIRSVFENDQIV